MQDADRHMVHESDVYASEGLCLSNDALCEEVLDKVLLHSSCLLRKLCQPSAYGSITDKVHHQHHASVWLQELFEDNAPVVALTVVLLLLHCMGGS